MRQNRVLYFSVWINVQLVTVYEVIVCIHYAWNAIRMCCLHDRVHCCQKSLLQPVAAYCLSP